jgi:hypothetical protein
MKTQGLPDNRLHHRKSILDTMIQLFDEYPSLSFLLLMFGEIN